MLFKILDLLLTSHHHWTNHPNQGEDARFFVWRPARWANWMFDVASYDKATNNFTFGRGGNQGARGSNQGIAHLRMGGGGGDEEMGGFFRRDCKERCLSVQRDS